VIEVTVIGELPMGADIQSEPSGYVAYAAAMGDQLWFETYPVIVETLDPRARRRVLPVDG
jgi:hypothetical protein